MMMRAGLWRPLLLVLLTIGGLALFIGRHGIPFVGRERVWSIGIYSGTPPFELQPAAECGNPVMTADDVNDVAARYVADPFLVRVNNGWVMFFEVFNRDNWRGELGYASSNDGCRWDYGGIVLREPFHLSYPQVIPVDGGYYMIPESGADRSVRLYRSVDFPRRWELAGTLLQGEAFRDSTVFYHQGGWWMFTAIENSQLRLYFADQLQGPWQPHPANPIIADDAGSSRPGGRVMMMGDHIFRLAQDDSQSYGRQVWAFEVTELTRQSYRERPASGQPLVAAGDLPWNSLGMHHIDAQPSGGSRWLAVVDGLSSHIRFGPGY